jgi:pimeloyl-ACP methyl ester carboxylesterase
MPLFLSGPLSRPPPGRREVKPVASPNTASSPTPVVFIHGLWLHAGSWNDWLTLFREAGYDTSAPGWPGDPESVADANAHPERLA